MEAVTETKQGYKKTKIGWIPEDWDSLTFKDVCKINQGLQIPISERLLNKEDGAYFYITNEFLKENSKNEYYIKNPTQSVICNENDILMTRTGNTGMIVRNVRGVFHNNFFKINLNDSCQSDFIYYYLSSNIIQRLILVFAGISTIPDLNHGDFYRIPLNLPPLLEQKKIAKILSTWDKAIEQTQNLIGQLKSRKKGLFDNLLLGKIRVNQKSKSFKKTKLGVEIPTDWDVKTVDSIFQERTEVSKDINQYPLYSLTIEKGLTEKTAQYERSFLLKDKENNKYRLVYNDDILYNPMNLRFGAIAKASISNPVSVSAYYNVLKPKDSKINIDYFINLFKTYRYMHIYDRIAIGSLEEKKRVHLSMFLKLELPYPPINEQLAITKILTTADKEIKTQETYLQQLQAQKKGLMQQLLTGQKRVIVNN